MHESMDVASSDSIRNDITDISRSLDKMLSCIETLESILEPVLKPAPTENNDMNAVPPCPPVLRSSLSNDLSSIHRRLNGLSSRIYELNGNIDL